MLYVANVDEAQIGKDSRACGPSGDRREDGGRAIALSGKVEAELAGLSEDEADEFRKELGIERSGLDDLAAEPTTCSAS